MKVLPGEPIEIWFLPDGTGFAGGSLLVSVDEATLERSGGLTVALLPRHDGWSATVEACNGGAPECSRAAIASAQGE